MIDLGSLLKASFWNFLGLIIGNLIFQKLKFQNLILELVLDFLYILLGLGVLDFLSLKIWLLINCQTLCSICCYPVEVGLQKLPFNLHLCLSSNCYSFCLSPCEQSKWGVYKNQVQKISPTCMLSTLGCL